MLARRKRRVVRRIQRLLGRQEVLSGYYGRWNPRRVRDAGSMRSDLGSPGRFWPSSTGDLRARRTLQRSCVHLYRRDSRHSLWWGVRQRAVARAMRRSRRVSDRPTLVSLGCCATHRRMHSSRRVASRARRARVRRRGRLSGGSVLRHRAERDLLFDDRVRARARIRTHGVQRHEGLRGSGEDRDVRTGRDSSAWHGWVLVLRCGSALSGEVSEPARLPSSRWLCRVNCRASCGSRSRSDLDNQSRRALLCARGRRPRDLWRYSTRAPSRSLLWIIVLKHLPATAVPRSLRVAMSSAARIRFASLIR